MRLKLKLVRPIGTVSDIVVTADSGATVGEVARIIRDRDPIDTAMASATSGTTVSVTFPGERSSTTLDSSTPISEARIASGAQIALVAEAGTGSGSTGPVLAHVRVVAGPDRGKEFELYRGVTVIGRDQDADLVLSDPLVSKRHTRVEVTRTVDLVDLNSANGIVVDGGQVTRISLVSGATAQLGDSVLRFDIVANLDEVAAEGRTGPIQFNRSPRVEARYPGEEYDGPEIPKEEDAIPFPWIALAAPILMGIVFLFLPQVSAIRFVFIALAPIIMIGTFVGQLSQRKRKLKLAIKKFDDQLDYLSKTLTEQVEIERACRLLEAPSTETVLDQSRQLGSMLWTRRPEHWSFLNLRLGVGSAPSRNSVSGANAKNGLPEFLERFEAFVEAHRLIHGVPLVENLDDAGALGVAGPPVEASEVTHALLVQVAGLYSPSEVAFASIVSPAWAAHFEWIKWLPHTTSPHTPLQDVQLADSLVSGNALLSALEALIEQRTGGEEYLDQTHGPVDLDKSVLTRGAKVGEDSGGEGEEDRPITPAIVLLISNDAPVDRARLVTLVEKAASAGIYPIWLSDSVPQLPAACRTFVDVAAWGDTATPESAAVNVGYVRVGEYYPAVSSRVAPRAALEFAMGLAGVSDAGAFVADESDIPRSVSFVTLLGPEMLDSSDAVIDRWRQNDSIHDRTPGAALRSRRAGKLRAIVGQSSLDSMHLDLRTQGPHALVGGTTGAGKSEFLQAWVLGMAAEYSPDRVTFLFVDYKGGSAFADCVQLPH